jgi:(p)ppGpp synthase/HD superfamily hydrolase
MDDPRGAAYAGPAAEVLAAARFERTRDHLAWIWSAGLRDRERVGKAVAWAVACHEDQEDRPDGTPYLEHVASVASRVVRWLGDGTADAVAAALLHDSVEDRAEVVITLGAAAPSAIKLTSETRALETIRAAFGDTVMRIVDDVTNPQFDRMIPRHAPGTPAHDAVYLLRYQEHFVHIMTGHEDSALIKLADFCDNALRLDVTKHTRPESYTWLVRKYGPCVAFLREHMPGLPGGQPLRRAWDTIEAAVEAAWQRDFAPPG